MFHCNSHSASIAFRWFRLTLHKVDVRYVGVTQSESGRNHCHNAEGWGNLANIRVNICGVRTETYVLLPLQAMYSMPDSTQLLAVSGTILWFSSQFRPIFIIGGRAVNGNPSPSTLSIASLSWLYDAKLAQKKKINTTMTKHWYEKQSISHEKWLNRVSFILEILQFT